MRALQPQTSLWVLAKARCRGEHHWARNASDLPPEVQDRPRIAKAALGRSSPPRQTACAPVRVSMTSISSEVVGEDEAFSARAILPLSGDSATPAIRGSTEEWPVRVVPCPDSRPPLSWTSGLGWLASDGGKLSSTRNP